MSILKTSTLLTILFSYSVGAQVGSNVSEKKLLNKLNQNNVLSQKDIQDYLKTIAGNRESQVEAFQQKYQDQLMNNTELSDDPMINEMHLKDAERKMENLKEQFEKAALKPTIKCLETDKDEFVDLNLQVKNICKKVKP